ncbi:AAA family ATPase [Ruania halotolerans]|uniref:AAA family ATPase n=1 Tax=Ruania halotolerans TaxID=2897773 RepID=UPI001E610194|nr:AAA family ATPase [Ruania halotolerans]UFU08051.1 AAA family ATPase [Ruania halotolerans]
MITTLAVQGYRSLQDIVIPLDGLTVISGANGTGKSSLYRALRLLAETAAGTAIASLAAEGGLASTRWAGPEHLSAAMRRGAHTVQGTTRRGPVRLQLGFSGDTFGYALDLGLPRPDVPTRFALDPEIKLETIWAGPLARPAAQLVRRRGPLVTVRDGRDWVELTHGLAPSDSCVSSLADPQRAPELLELRESMRTWRFYDHLRTDAGAPARATVVGTRTPVLAADGSDLAAALATIEEIGRADVLASTLEHAFASTITITAESGRFALALHQPGLLRPLSAPELSDGTLRYLMLAAALLTPRPPELMVLNEPETSLHPELIEPLAHLMKRAAEEMQVVVVTHSDRLREHLGTASHVHLVKEWGATEVDGQGTLDRPSWTWPTRG